MVHSTVCTNTYYRKLYRMFSIKLVTNVLLNDRPTKVLTFVIIPILHHPRYILLAYHAHTQRKWVEGDHHSYLVCKMHCKIKILKQIDCFLINKRYINEQFVFVKHECPAGAQTKDKIYVRDNYKSNSIVLVSCKDNRV